MSRYGAVLLSRQALRPTRTTSWVGRTVSAVRWLGEQQLGLISSIGIQTWELATALAAANGLPLRLLLPARSPAEFYSLCDNVSEDFGLKLDRAEFMPVFLEKGEGLNDMMVKRDTMIIQQADILLPVALRESGNMAALIERASESGVKIDRRFQIKYSRARRPLKLSLNGLELDRPIKGLDGKYLVHWTRAINQPWPKERRLDFYRAILESDTWPRAGIDTLKRILQMKKILASGRNMPDKIPTVSFTALPPREVVPLMRWRARHGEMSFEPYGIGLEREVALGAGLQLVDYFEPGEEKSIPRENRWFSQSAGRITDWREELEYRHLGHFTLEKVPPDAIVLFCMTGDEAAQLKEQYPYRVWSFLP